MRLSSAVDLNELERILRLEKDRKRTVKILQWGIHHLLYIMNQIRHVYGFQEKSSNTHFTINTLQLIYRLLNI